MTTLVFKPIDMLLKKETDGTFVYATKNAHAASKSIYLSKFAIPEGTPEPQEIEVTIRVKS